MSRRSSIRSNSTIAATLSFALTLLVGLIVGGASAAQADGTPVTVSGSVQVEGAVWPDGATAEVQVLPLTAQGWPAPGSSPGWSSVQVDGTFSAQVGITTEVAMYFIRVQPTEEFSTAYAPGRAYMVRTGNGDVSGVQVNLLPSRVQILVTDDTGTTPISNASVWVYAANTTGQDVQWFPRDGYSTTDSAGSYSYAIYPGEPSAQLKFVVQPQGQSSQEFVIVPDAAPMVQTVVYRDPNVSGWVVDQEDAPVAGAWVEVRRQLAGNDWDEFVTGLNTDEEGRFGGYVDPALLQEGDALILVVNSPSGRQDVVGTRVTVPGGLPVAGLAIQLPAPNMALTVVKTVNGVSTPVEGAQVTLTEVDSNGNYVRWLSSSQTGGDGVFVSYVGTPEDLSNQLRVEVNPPNTEPDYVKTYAYLNFTELSADPAATEIELLAPNLVVTVLDGASGVVERANFSVQRLDGNGWKVGYVTGGQTDSNGQVRVNIDPARYPYGVALEVTPPQSGYETYVVTELRIAPEDLGGEPQILELKSANFFGCLVYGVPPAPVRNAWINAWTPTQRQVVGGQTDSEGCFKMNVPDASETTEWPLNLSAWLGSDATYGSNRFESQRNVTFSVARPNPVAAYADPGNPWTAEIPGINLRVKVSFQGPGSDAPGDARNVNVNLFRAVGGAQLWVANGQTDDQGVAAFSVAEPSAQFVVEATPHQYSQPAEVRAFAPTRVGPIAADGEGVISVALQQPTATIYVMDDGGNAVSNAWLWLRPVNSTQGFSAQTDESGEARLYIPDASVQFEINAGPPWGQGDSGLSQFRDQAYLELDDDGYATYTVVLPTSNFRGLVVTDPTNEGADPLPEAQLEFRDADTGWGVAWTNADSSGRANVKLDDGSYDLIVRPSSWRAGASQFGSRTYSLTVEDGEVTQLGSAGTPAAFDDVEGRWIVGVRPASVQGVVLDPNGQPVWNSWVEVLRENEGGWMEWIDGISTSQDGTFGLTFGEGTYTLRAQPSWGVAGVAPSSPCDIEIGAEGEVLSSSCQIDPDTGGITLDLQAPNLTLAIENSSGAPVPFSYACLTNTGDWTCAPADEFGHASFSVSVDDATRLRMIDDGQTVIGSDPPQAALVVQVNPPWGSEDLVSAEVRVGLVTTDNIVYQPLPPGDVTVTLSEPNAVIDVTYPGEPVKPAFDGWVSLYADINGHFGEWMGGAPVGPAGSANFNLADTGGPYCVEVWPGWSDLDEFSRVQECGVAFDDGPVAVSLQAANVLTTVYDADGLPNSWGWVLIDDGSSQFGAALDHRGNLAIFLDDQDEPYELTFYPGPRRLGVPTTVSVTVQGGSPVGLGPELLLAAGNASGTVVDANEVPVSGAIVSFDGGSDLVTAVGDETGHFVANLDAGTNYSVTVIAPPDWSGDPTRLSVRFDGGASVLTGGSITW